MLTPLSWLYGLGTGLRNTLYNMGVLRSWHPSVPTICVGNLAVGGTGKTPHVAYITARLKDRWHVAILSRGYKRRTSGFLLADEESTAETIGDEAMQQHMTFPDVPVAVCENRRRGIQQLMMRHPETQVIILDDAFQHRQVDAGLKIVLSDYSNPYYSDRLMPLGRLRENPSGAHRADMVVITKCPTEFKPVERRLIADDVSPFPYQTLCFSSVKYGELCPVFAEAPEQTLEQLRERHAAVLILAGIAHPESMVEYMNGQLGTTDVALYPDHHYYTAADFTHICRKLQQLNAAECVVVTTQKDAARLLHNPDLPDTLKQLTYALPIETDLGKDTDMFNSKIEVYVRENNRNR